jgi:hypothetical protein
VEGQPLPVIEPSATRRNGNGPVRILSQAEFTADRADLLAERGDLGDLRARADAGDGRAGERLAGLLAESRDLDGAMQVLRALADAGSGSPTGRLADMLADLLTQQGKAKRRGDCAGSALIQTGRSPVGEDGLVCRPRRSLTPLQTSILSHCSLNVSEATAATAQTAVRDGKWMSCSHLAEG